ncbi:hydrogenase maturation protease [Streptomyces sp. NPDC058773]|uniref:hydrogenase maturation protease n=1 Tax=Streptomyces sp. NPDC058773 TaxID=3346632 RepID=UPI00369BDAF2
METSTAAARIAVIGVGNAYRHDDGVGWAVVAGLAQRSKQRPFPHDISFTCTDGEPARLISAWEHVRLAIIVDAARARPARPGRVHRLRLRRGDGMPRSLHGETGSHGFALQDTVRLAHALDRLPGELLVYVVEAADISLGPGLSPQVAATIGPLTQRIEEDILHCAPTRQ